VADAPSGPGQPLGREFAAFDPFLRDYTTTWRVLRAASSFADAVEDLGRPTESGSQAPFEQAIVIDERALLLGFVSVGVEVRGQESSAAWVVEWLEARNVDLAQILSEQASLAVVSARPSADVEIVPSRSVRDRILPAAVDLAKRTVGRERADARHLLCALLLYTPVSSLPFKDIIDADALQDAKRTLVEHLERSHEENENLDVWRSLVAEPPSMEASPASPSPGETVGTLSDAPALVDALGRQAFAEVLATRAKQVYETLRSGTLGNDSAFILHIDGPWGSGKSSILNFLKSNLEQSQPQWLIVEFNAWRNQQRTPAWWPIISHVWTTVRGKSFFSYLSARWVWTSWNVRTRWVPLLVSLLSLLVLAALVLFATDPGKGYGFSKEEAEWIDKLAKIALGLVGLGGLVWTGTRNIMLGSKSAAETYVQSSAEPFRPIVRLYERLICAIDSPVAIFIDDIDRCDSSYVIDLLEGIQTLLRSAPVVYVVAGDRKWICSSFEKRYIDFGGQIGVPGRPLGYLFLDKVFQLSTAIPRLSTLRQAAYWRRLLETGQNAEERRDEVQRLEAKAVQELKGKTSHEDIQKEIDRTEEGSLERETIRAAAAKQITSPEAIRAAEHRLQPLAGLLEPNPRSMKRLVNAYGLNHARAFLEGRTVAVEALARWTIVELRWPILADYLATNWSDVATGNLTSAQFPEVIRALLADSDVKEVFGRDGEIGRLTIETLSPILE
jgi:hypothetical protein